MENLSNFVNKLQLQFRCKMKNSISMLIIVILVSGCSGGGTRPDGSREEVNNDGVLGALVLAGVIWGAKKIISSNDTGISKQQENEDMLLVPVATSVYDKLSYFGDEPKKFGVYTYVLFGKYPARGENSELYRKYKAILDLVQEKPYWPEYKKPISSGLEKDEQNEVINTEEMNVYLIPIDEGNTKRVVSVSEYDFDFSMRILRTVIGERAGHEFKNKFISEGPFLISMPNTIQKNGKKHALFADLTDVNEEMFLEIFRSYEKALNNGSNSEKDPFGILENIRIDLGQKLVKINDIFRMVGDAYASE